MATMNEVWNSKGMIVTGRDVGLDRDINGRVIGVRAKYGTALELTIEDVKLGRILLTVTEEDEKRLTFS